MKRTLEEHLDNSEMRTINMITKKFEIFGSKLYVFVDDESLTYVEQYIETVRQGNPDKESVVKKYMEEIHSFEKDQLENIMKRNPNILMGSNSHRIVSYLNQIERDLKPILEAIKRDKKIDDLLS